MHKLIVVVDDVLAFGLFFNRKHFKYFCAKMAWGK